MSVATAATPFETLARYERLSLAHGSDTRNELDAPGLWRGIGYRVGTRMLASEIGEINELLALPPLAAIPGAQPWLLGIANVRGNLMPVIDFGRYLFGERTPVTDRTRLLVVRQSGGNAALLVDEVFGQRTVDAQQWQTATAEDDARLARFAEQQVGSDPPLAILSMERLVQAADFRQAAA